MNSVAPFSIDKGGSMSKNDLQVKPAAIAGLEPVHMKTAA
jgi:hypothetical protein